MIGVIEIPLPDDKFMAIDVIEKVPPLTEDHVFKRAISMTNPDGLTYLVLHPVDLLASRAYNLRNFEDKQNANGIEQLHIALRVVHAYLSSALADSANERKVLKIVEKIVRLAKGPNGAAAKGYGVNFLTGMPLDMIRNESFRNKRRLQLEQELAEVKPPYYLASANLSTITAMTAGHSPLERTQETVASPQPGTS